MKPTRFAVAAALFVSISVPAYAAGAGASAPAPGGADAGLIAIDPVAQAEAAVEAARANLRDALAKGKGVAQAREQLRTALHNLDVARQTAGLPPAPPNPDDNTPPANNGNGTAGDNGNPPPPPAATTTTPPDVGNKPPPPPKTNAPDVTPPSGQTPPPPKNPPTGADNKTPPDTTAPPTNTPPPSANNKPPPGTKTPPTATEPPAGEVPPPPPPPAADAPTFDLNKFRERPLFGVIPKALQTLLPPTDDSIKEGGEVVTPGGRTITREGGQIIVNHDDLDRVRQQGDDVTTANSGNGMTTETVRRPNGTEIVTVRGPDGSIVQRYRRNPDGTVVTLIGGPGGKSLKPPPTPQFRPPSVNLDLGPLQLNIPTDQYIVDSSQANTQQLERTLMAPPVETVERPYTLEEIRRSGRLRDKVRRIDFDTITFDTGQATIPDNEIGEMQSIGTALRTIIQNDPSQVFLIEGHTDAVGSDLSNLALSDRRAETVAEILSYYFGIPAENLVTQGYGEQYLKVPTTAANRENRRVAFRNITDLLQASR